MRAASSQLPHSFLPAWWGSVCYASPYPLAMQVYVPCKTLRKRQVPTPICCCAPDARRQVHTPRAQLLSPALLKRRAAPLRGRERGRRCCGHPSGGACRHRRPREARPPLALEGRGRGPSVTSPPFPYLSIQRGRPGTHKNRGAPKGRHSERRAGGANSTRTTRSKSGERPARRANQAGGGTPEPAPKAPQRQKGGAAGHPVIVLCAPVGRPGRAGLGVRSVEARQAGFATKGKRQFLKRRVEQHRHGSRSPPARRPALN